MLLLYNRFVTCLACIEQSGTSPCASDLSPCHPAPRSDVTAAKHLCPSRTRRTWWTATMPLWHRRHRSRSSDCSLQKTQTQAPHHQGRCLLLLLLPLLLLLLLRRLLLLLMLVQTPRRGARNPKRLLQRQPRRDRVSSAAMNRSWVLDLG